MSKIRLPEQNKLIDLRSYKAKEQVFVERKQAELVEDKISLFEFRKEVIKLCYPELVEEIADWPAADLSYLVSVVLKYSTGGPEAVKNFLVSGSGIQETT